MDPLMALKEGTPTPFGSSNESAVTGDLLIDFDVGAKRSRADMQPLMEEGQRPGSQSGAIICSVINGEAFHFTREPLSHGQSAVAEAHSSDSRRINGLHTAAGAARPLSSSQRHFEPSMHRESRGCSS